jgi:hypothetical protein
MIIFSFSRKKTSTLVQGDKQLVQVERQPKGTSPDVFCQWIWYGEAKISELLTRSTSVKVQETAWQEVFTTPQK